MIVDSSRFEIAVARAMLANLSLFGVGVVAVAVPGGSTIVDVSGATCCLAVMLANLSRRGGTEAPVVPVEGAGAGAGASVVAAGVDCCCLAAILANLSLFGASWTCPSPSCGGTGLLCTACKLAKLS